MVREPVLLALFINSSVAMDKEYFEGHKKLFSARVPPMHNDLHKGLVSFRYVIDFKSDNYS